MAEGDTHFEVSATLRLKKSKFEKDAKRVARAIDPLARGLKRASAKANVLSFNMLELARKQKMAQRASEQAERAAQMAERAVTRLAEKRSREMERLVRQTRRAEMAMSRLNRKIAHRGIKGGFSTAQGMMGGGGAAAGVGRMAGPAAMIAGGVATLGVGAAVVQGLRFNKLMDDTRNSVATMFGMFDVGKAYVKEGASGVEIFDKNVQLAEGAMARLLKLQEATPAGLPQLLQVFGQGIAGLAKGTKDVDRMLELTTQLSLLGPALNNDYGQLGRDTMRILSGSAEQEVQVWRLLRTQIFEEAKKIPNLLPKGMKDGEKFVKLFNKNNFDPANRMLLLERAMAKLGPKYREMFAKSMSGLLTTSGSKLLTIAGKFTKPLSDAFQNSMARANLGTDEGRGLLSGGMTERWMGIARYFGSVLGTAAAKLLLAFERGMFYVDQHWSAITDNIILAFKIGGVIIQAYIAKAIAGLLMAPGLMAGRGAVGAGKGLFGFFSKFTKRRSKMGGSKLGLMSNMGDLGKSLGLMAKMAGPSIIAFVAVGAALAVVGVAAAAIAIYITKNWDKIVKSIVDRWGEIGPKVEKLYLQFDYLMGVMGDIGDTLLGGSTGADKFIKLLGWLEEAFYAAAQGIVYMLKGLRFLNLHSQASADQDVEEARQEKQNAQMSFDAQAKRHSGSEKDEFELAMRKSRLRRANKAFAGAQKEASDIATRGYDLNTIERQISMAMTPEAKAERKRLAESRAKATLEALEESAGNGKGKGKGKPPKGGVHITNQYNTWDLRQTDPDRIMSAFIPKLEALADKRTQSYEQVEQGV